MSASPDSRVIVITGANRGLGVRPSSHELFRVRSTDI